MTVRRFLRLLTVGTAAVLLVVGCGENGGEGSQVSARDVNAEDGCGEVSPIIESTEFTSYEDQNGYPYAPIKASPVDSGILRDPPFQAEIDGLPARGMYEQAGQVQVYYAAEPIPDMDPTSVVADGGLTLQLLPVTSGTWDVESMFKEIESRVTPVRVGEYEGALTWADPDAEGVRPHYLQWGAGKLSWRLVGEREPEELLAIGRGLVC